MDATEILIICVIAYLTTGIALTGYDFSAPPIEKKGYVISQNYNIAMFIWFTWPLSSMFEVYQKQKLGRSWFRFFFGVILLASGMFFWGKLIFMIADKLIGIIWINAIIMLVFLVFTSPILTAMAMPKHGQP